MPAAVSMSTGQAAFLTVGFRDQRRPTQRRCRRRGVLATGPIELCSCKWDGCQDSAPVRGENQKHKNKKKQRIARRRITINIKTRIRAITGIITRTTKHNNNENNEPEMQTNNESKNKTKNNEQQGG